MRFLAARRFTGALAAALRTGGSLRTLEKCSLRLGGASLDTTLLGERSRFAGGGLQDSCGVKPPELTTSDLVSSFSNLIDSCVATTDDEPPPKSVGPSEEPPDNALSRSKPAIPESSFFEVFFGGARCFCAALSSFRAVACAQLA